MSESPPGSGFAYRAFISYSHADRVCADWLHKSLETYRVPSRLVGKETAAGIIPRRLSPIFRDRDELASAHDLGNKVNEALARSEALVVICSPASAQSRWVNEEVLAFKRLGRTERIFCLIADGEPNASDKPGREREECFCPALRYTLDEQGQPTSERTEPIAADARAGKDGKSNAKLKLIAGLLDVGFDRLKQREQHRKMQRMVALTLLAVVVMAVTVVLAVFALISRHQAVIAQHTAVAAQHTAVVAQQAAERRQKQAENLVDFMLGDLNDKLRQLGRPDIMQAVDDKATAYFESLPAADVTDTELGERAKTLEKIGGIRLGDSSYPRALEAFRASAHISSRLAAKAPTNVAKQVAYSRTLAFIAMSEMYQSKWIDAERALNLARQVLEPPLKQVPDDPALLIQMAYLDNNIGHVLESRGQPDSAETDYHAMLALTKKLFASHPDNPDYVQALGVAHSNLGRLALQRGDLATSIDQYRTGDAVQTRASVRHPKDDDQRTLMMHSHAELGRALASAGDVRTAMRDLQQPIEFSAEAVKGEARDAWDLAIYSVELARLKRLSGDMRAADALDATALEIFATQSKKEQSNRRAEQYLADAMTEQAELLRATGRTEAARAEAQNALNTLDPMLAQKPDMREILLPAMRANLLVASMTTDAITARRLREHTLQTVQAVKAGRSDPRLLALRVEALLALDLKSDAQPLIKQLWSDGYRDPGFVDVLKRARVDYPPNPAFQAKLATAEAQIRADAVLPTATKATNSRSVNSFKAETIHKRKPLG